MIHHGETEIAPIFRTDSSVLIQKELSLMPMGQPPPKSKNQTDFVQAVQVLFASNGS